MSGQSPRRSSPSRNASVALLLGGVVCGMVGLSFAAVPLYRLFCQVTGYGGTTQVASSVPETATERNVKVRFNADVNPELPWSFQPAEREISLRVGAPGQAVYVAKNLGDRPLTGTATFNVTPLRVGQYFEKVQCFCFTEQRLEPGQEVEMGVSFFVDPAMLEDPDLVRVKTITLSYTFFPAPQEPRERQQAGSAGTRRGVN